MQRVDGAWAVDKHDAAVAEVGHVVDEQAHRAGLVHDDVVAAVGTAPVHVDVRDLAHSGVGAGQPQGSGQQQAVGGLSPPGGGRRSAASGVGRFLHHHDDVAALAVWSAPRCSRTQIGLRSSGPRTRTRRSGQPQRPRENVTGILRAAVVSMRSIVSGRQAGVPLSTRDTVET